ncbi:aminoglycoside phosphotransferase family protein [Streptomyces sp. NBC_00287]|uniref:aminoglycoside phosphotransferase family protein n=1 Tax=Streptomyces sp. NBC_00287 TaxID=2975702 RepID=UPI002E2B97BD|nr:aminoglycoside phosphotransferase family protein [Streptomyces sp. NBC_00287]
MITSLADPRLTLARQAVGAVRVVADPGLPPHLVRLVDVREASYVAKQHHRQDRYTQELHAYSSWGRHLSGYAAQLVAHDDSTDTLLFTALEGANACTARLSPAERERMYEAAGLVLGRLHRATAEGPAPSSELATRLLGWIATAEQGGLISADERRILQSHGDVLAGTVMDRAVCHLDYQPRNWLVDAEQFRVCDFEHMRRDARVRDFARLEFRHWQSEPRLREAFFTGYGTQMTDAERQLLVSFGAIEAVTAIVRGHERNATALSAHGRAVLARLA